MLCGGDSGALATGAHEGFVLLAATEEDASLHPGDVVAEVRAGLVQTAACECGAAETVFRTEPQADPCESCGISKLAKREESCFACGSAERVAASIFQKCSSSRGPLDGRGKELRSVSSLSLPQPPSWQAASEGVPCKELQSSILQLSPSCPTSLRATSGEKRQEATPPCWTRRPRAEDLAGMDPEKVPFKTCLLQNPVSPGRSGTPATFALTRARSWRTRFQLRSALQMEEPPTDAYYEALSKDLRDRRKKACPHLLDHLVSLEAFLDKSILFGFSFRINKAEVCVSEGKLLGHKIGRRGSAPDEESCQAVVDFPPLKEKLHIQQFLGCANWLRGYLPAEYGHAAKVLGQWQKPGAAFPDGGLGSAASEGCKAFRAIIKKMMQQHICLVAFDEAAAADGSCPLEQIADASGIGVRATGGEAGDQEDVRFYPSALLD